MPLPNERDGLADFSASKNFINRELSWLEFNAPRLLKKAAGAQTRRCSSGSSFSHCSSNLDDFEIPSPHPSRQIASETSVVGPDGMSRRRF